MKRGTGSISGCALVLILLAAPQLAPAQRADAGECYTTGRTYVQKRVFDKACWFLECARKEEPENVDVLSLLSFARAQQRQYISAGAAFQMGIDAARKKKDEKSAEELERNRIAVNAQLFSAGVSALNRAGTVEVTSERTSGDATTPQGRAEKKYGAPREFVRIKEQKSGSHEFWYYPESKMMLSFGPGADEVTKLDYVPYEGRGDPRTAVTDTIPFPPYSGSSASAEAAYYFELASYVDPSSLEAFQNLTYALTWLGRYEDAIRAAEFALRLHPGDERLARNLDAARSHRESRTVRAALPLVAGMTCDSADCALQWQRAQLWLSRHSVRQIQIATEVVFQTAHPMQGESGYGFRVSRRPLQAGRYEIAIEAACGMPLEECSPPWDQVRSAFLQYLRTGDDALDGRDLTGSSLR